MAAYGCTTWPMSIVQAAYAEWINCPDALWQDIGCNGGDTTLQGEVKTKDTNCLFVSPLENKGLSGPGPLKISEGMTDGRFQLNGSG